MMATGGEEAGKILKQTPRSLYLRDVILSQSAGGRYHYLIFAECSQCEEKETSKLEPRIQCNTQLMLYTLHNTQYNNNNLHFTVIHPSTNGEVEIIIIIIIKKKKTSVTLNDNNGLMGSLHSHTANKSTVQHHQLGY